MKKIEKRESIVLSNEGLQLFGMLHTPLKTKEKKLPAILICHGFGGNKCGRHRMYVKLAEFLAMHGILSLRIDFRGCGDSEGSFSDATILGEVSDSMKALEFLSDHPQVDSERIGILGRSLGGAIAVMAAARYQKIKAIALWSVLFNAEPWKEAWKNKSKQGVELLDDELIRVDDKVVNIGFVKDFFAIDLDEDLRQLAATPMLNFHGALDDVVDPYFHPSAFLNYRKESETESYFKLFSRSDHDFTDPDERREAIEQTAQWFYKFL